MNNIKINYSVELNSATNQTLDVKMFISGLTDTETFKLYRGNSLVSNIKSFTPITNDATCVNFAIGQKDTCLIEYTAKLGMPSKHGRYGHISDDSISFCGEEVLLLPYECIAIKDDKTSYNFEIEVLFKFRDKISLVPFNNEGRTVLTTNSFSEIFEFLKSAYVFTNKEENIINDNFKLYTGEAIDEKTKLNLASLYNFYKDLFKCDANLVITCLEKIEDKNIFSGGANCNIAASFNLNNKKDLLFLSHRMFYAFLETSCKTQAIHIPPNLWVTKGLAGYYQSKALDVFDDATKEDLKLSFEEDMKTLYRVYLYSLKTNEKIFSIPPIVEGSLKSTALLEYLHSVKAPLLIKFFEEKSTLEHDDKFINYLLSVKDFTKFSQPAMFNELLKDETSEYAKNYIFNSRSLVFDMDISKDSDIIRKEFAEFDALMKALFTIDRNRFEANQKKSTVAK